MIQASFYFLIFLGLIPCFFGLYGLFKNKVIVVKGLFISLYLAVSLPPTLFIIYKCMTINSAEFIPGVFVIIFVLLPAPAIFFLLKNRIILLGVTEELLTNSLKGSFESMAISYELILDENTLQTSGGANFTVGLNKDLGTASIKPSNHQAKNILKRIPPLMNKFLSVTAHKTQNRAFFLLLIFGTHSVALYTVLLFTDALS